MMVIKIGIQKKNHRRRHPFNNVDGYISMMMIKKFACARMLPIIV